MRISDWSSDVCSSDLDQCLHRYETTSMPPRWQRHGTRALEMRDYRFKNAVAVRGGHTQFQIGWPAEYRPNISIDLADEFGEVLVILKRRGRVSESLSFYKYCLRWATTSVCDHPTKQLRSEGNCTVPRTDCRAEEKAH